MTGQYLNWQAAETCAQQLLGRWDGRDPGGALVSFDSAGERFDHATGVADLATGAAFCPDTLSRLASVTKHVFCSFVLAHGDVIALTDPLGRHLPKLAPALGAITVGQALDMSGGVPDTREALTLLGHSVYTRSEAPDLLAFHEAMQAPSYAPGTEVHYSNGGYRLVEEALRAKGLDFAPYITELSQPLGLDFVAQDYWIDPLAGLAPGYWAGAEGWQIGMQGMHLSAAGALAGSGRSLARWGRALLAGEGAQAGLLEQLSAPRHLSDGLSTGYGLGVRHQKIGPHGLIGHGGSQPGYKSFLLMCPEAGVGVAMVANRDDANGADMTAQVLAVLLGQQTPATAAHGLAPGLYVAPEGADWLEITSTTACRLDDEVALYAAPDGWADSGSPTSRLQLHMDGGDIVGFVGHAPVHFSPAHSEDGRPKHLEGCWQSDLHGGMLEINEGAVVIGAGPTRQVMPLQSLGNGRYLFSRLDPPCSRRICLCETGADCFTLSLSRARGLGWHRIF
ncbi:hypothetical protein P775_11905 [Puniceibacterium antarcticum]|uniref:Beta-lactamase-related domain-containing protein n=1 Tax=Puniceibacterium antarcticum TaxID=1206336 RepID=A0A2G8REJ1_9RHOB|nr:serine hydrolase domain-containing protein [Puniceibacterium antarcticum]PIL19960.1 hypothetical protein P775_11905 [Puniceibacterium antarcticum]